MYYCCFSSTPIFSTTLILLQCHRYHHVITLPSVCLFFSHSLALSINYVRWLGGPYTVEDRCPPSPLGWHCQFYLPDEVEPCLVTSLLLPTYTSIDSAFLVLSQRCMHYSYASSMWVHGMPLQRTDKILVSHAVSRTGPDRHHTYLPHTKA